MATGILSKNTTLGYSETEDGTFSIITGLQSFPDMGSDPESVDTTTLLNSSMTYIDGLSDPGSLQYGCLYIASEFEELESNKGITLFFKQSYPDGSTHTFQGQGTPIMGGKGVNEALGYNYYVKPSTDIVYTPVTPAP